MTLDDLAAYGANVDEGLKRCMDNEAFYLRMVETVRADQGFGELPQAVAEGRLKDAFGIAHSLKGALGNLAITPLYDPMRKITEYLRVETDMDYAPLIDHIMREYDRFCAL